MRVLTLTLILLGGCNAYGNDCFLPISGHVVYEDAGIQRISVGVGSWEPNQPKGHYENDDDAGVSAAADAGSDEWL